MRTDMHLMKSRALSGFGIGLALLLVSSTMPAARAELEITEIMYDANDDDVWEWIEVRNTGVAPVDLNGYIGFNLGAQEPTTLNPSIDNTLAMNTVIGAGEVGILYDGTQSAASGFPNYDDASFRQAWGLDSGVPLIATRFWPRLSNTNGSQNQSIGFWPDANAYDMDVEPVEDDPENEPGVFTDRVTSFSNAAFSINYSADFPTAVPGSSITWNGNGNYQSGNQWSGTEIGQTGVTTSVEVQVPGFINSTNDFGNPGVAPPGTPTTPGLHITEILYDSGGAEPDWEWIEIYNSTEDPINLAGYVLDDANSVAHGSSNIASGIVQAGEAAIFFNADDVSAADFAAAWGASLNLIEVTNWSAMSLNNGTDTIGLWSTFESYEGNNQTLANAILTQGYDENGGFPAPSQGPSLSLTSLDDQFFDPADGGSWEISLVGDANGSFNALPVSGGSGTIVFHPGGDIASPGEFEELVLADVDLDQDGDVDGDDFLMIQRSNPALIPDWQAQYPIAGGSLSGLGAVPEPASVALIGLAMACVTIVRRK